MKKFGNVALIAVAMAMLACVGMWGCGDKVSFDWGKYRGDKSVAGFINDSLVIVTDCRHWHEIMEGWNGSYSEETSCGHDRMLIYNYRVQEDGPRWTDSLTNKSGGYRWHQLTDSIIWRWEGKNILLWKVGKTARELKVSRKNEGCSQPFEVNRMHQWLNNDFIALGGKLSAEGDGCQYAVLDTLSRMLTYKRLGKGLEWIRECDDVRAWGEDVVCLKRRDNELLNLLVNNEGKDSVYVTDTPSWDFKTVSLAMPSFYGNLFYWAYINSIDSDNWKIKLTPNVRPLSFPGFGQFVDEKKELISY